jgi:hypothetical protein
MTLGLTARGAKAAAPAEDNPDPVKRAITALQ